MEFKLRAFELLFYKYNESEKMGLIGKTNAKTKNKLLKDHGFRRKRQHPLPGAFNGKKGKLMTVCHKSQITY